jgi:hypothetical protein
VLLYPADKKTVDNSPDFYFLKRAPIVFPSLQMEKEGVIHLKSLKRTLRVSSSV